MWLKPGLPAKRWRIFSALRCACMPSPFTKRYATVMKAEFPGCSVVKTRAVPPSGTWVTGRVMRMDTTAQLPVTILTVQSLGEPVAHIPVKCRFQPGNGQRCLKVVRRTFQYHGRPEAVPFQPVQTLLRHIVNEDMMFPPGQRREQGLQTQGAESNPEK